MDRSILSRPGPRPDRTLAYGDEPDQVADVFLPKSTGRTLVVLLHGGFWRPSFDRLHVRPMADALRGAGLSVLSLDYRREPGNPAATVDDVRRALEVLPGQLPEASATVLAGHSAGGQLALWVASTCPPEGLAGTLALAPVADLQAAYERDLGNGAVEAFLGGGPEEYEHLDPIALPEAPTATTILHGVDDTVVPPVLSQSYVEVHPAARLVLVPSIGHFELIDPVSIGWPRVLAELDSLIP